MTVELVPTVYERRAQIEQEKQTKAGWPAVHAAMRKGEAGYREAGAHLSLLRETLKGTFVATLKAQGIATTTAYRLIRLSKSTPNILYTDLCNPEPHLAAQEPEANQMEEDLDSEEDFDDEEPEQPGATVAERPIVQGDETPPSVERHEAAVRKAAEPTPAKPPLRKASKTSLAASSEHLARMIRCQERTAAHALLVLARLRRLKHTDFRTVVECRDAVVQCGYGNPKEDRPVEHALRVLDFESIRATHFEGTDVAWLDEVKGS